MSPRIGLVLTGGGARAAYQVGVLKALAEFCPVGCLVPFRIICGTSAGAINASALASRADHFQHAVAELLDVWENFHTEQVFRTEAHLALHNGLRWMLTMLGVLPTRRVPNALLDNQPLRELLQRRIPLQQLQSWIDAEYLDALAITAASYQTGQSVTFYQGSDQLTPWLRSRRIGIPRPITHEHLMASAAIPFVFPSVRIGYEHYGDGSMRQLAPLSPALHLGAERILVIGARNEDIDIASQEHLPRPPSLGQIAGYVLDTLFMDSLSMDVERLRRVNHTLGHIPVAQRAHMALRPVALEWLSPSQDVRVIAARHLHELPRSLRWLLARMGAMNRGGRPLISYLLFESGFCRALIDLGYRDALRQRSRLCHLLGVAA